jgi:hypothetical protein
MKHPMTRLARGGVAILLFSLCGFTMLSAQTSADEFVLPDHGCPMEHCDRHMSDNLHVSPPMPQVGETVGVIWHDQHPYGSWNGLGCSGNDDIVACTLRNVAGGDNLIVYDSQGQAKWTSGDLLNHTAISSAPIVSTTGEVIACDNKN